MGLPSTKCLYAYWSGLLQAHISDDLGQRWKVHSSSFRHFDLIKPFHITSATHKFVGNKAKRRISKQVSQENKAFQIFQKTNISYALIRARVVFVKFSVLCFLETSVLRFALLPYGLRIHLNFTYFAISIDYLSATA